LPENEQLSGNSSFQTSQDDPDWQSQKHSPVDRAIAGLCSDLEFLVGGKKR